jgi:TPP-dependent indolepyruvate ferredoxin oxidoreductase alpha subunit
MGASAVQVASPVLEHGVAWINQVVAAIEADSCNREENPHLNAETSRFSVCRSRCLGCGLCTQQMMCCAVIMKSDGAHILNERCEGCGYCAAICPNRAIVPTDSVTNKKEKP